MRRLCQISVVVLLLVAAAWAVKRYAVILILKATIGTPTREEMYPKATRLPPRVDASMATLLARLEQVLSQKCPYVLANLNPGLSDGEIAKLENESGIKLSKELKELYAWHNGCKRPTDDFIPMYSFRPFESVIAEKRRLAEEVGKMDAAQKEVWQTYVSYTDDWLRIFPDPSRDGYVYDPTRTYGDGALFHCCIEMNSFRYFPSLENLLAYFLECYETGIYSFDAETKTLSADFEKAEDIVGRYAEKVR
jgi:cell wall assembly regulator SMI1